MVEVIRQRVRAAARPGDLGLTLVEVMVACVILMILAGAVFGVLLASFKTTRGDKLRVAASSLAEREAEIVRQYFQSGSDAVSDVVDPAHSTRTNYYPLQAGSQGQPLVVDGVPFTVVDKVAVQVLGPGVSACDGGSAVAHPSYSLTVTVTWPNMTARPVVNQTVLTPPKGVIDDSSFGYLAVKVTDAAGHAAGNIMVNVAGPAGTFSPVTDSSGCAVVALNQAGAYAASLSRAGYVDFYGNPTPTLGNIGVTVGELVVKAMTYDAAATINAAFTTASGYSPPATLPYVTVANSGLQPTGTESVAASGNPGAIANLWPFTSGYTLWAGSCADSDPAASGSSRGTPLVIPPGQSVAAQITLAPLDVQVNASDGDPVVGATVTASEANAGNASQGCQSDATLTLGTTNANGHLATSLPNGSWVVSVQGSQSGALSVTGSPSSTQIDLP